MLATTEQLFEPLFTSSTAPTIAQLFDYQTTPCINCRVEVDYSGGPRVSYYRFISSFTGRSNNSAVVEWCFNNCTVVDCSCWIQERISRLLSCCQQQLTTAAVVANNFLLVLLSCWRGATSWPMPQELLHLIRGQMNWDQVSCRVNFGRDKVSESLDIRRATD